MGQHPVNHVRLGDERDDAHGLATPGTAQRVDLEDPAEQLRFAAPLIGAVVRLDCLTRGERRRLEERAVEALRSRGRALRAAERISTDAQLDPKALDELRARLNH